jgi:hypothetical protein
MWTITLPVVTTAHISRATCVALENRAAIAGVMESASYSHGFFVRFNFEPIDDMAKLLPDIAALRCWALRRKHDWVRIDADGDEVDGLPKFDW